MTKIARGQRLLA